MADHLSNMSFTYQQEQTDAQDGDSRAYVELFLDQLSPATEDAAGNGRHDIPVYPDTRDSKLAADGPVVWICGVIRTCPRDEIGINFWWFLANDMLSFAVTIRSSGFVLNCWGGRVPILIVFASGLAQLFSFCVPSQVVVTQL